MKSTKNEEIVDDDDDDESDKHIEARDRRYSCLNFVKVTFFINMYLKNMVNLEVLESDS